jgi:hypothetical protein
MSNQQMLADDIDDDTINKLLLQAKQNLMNAKSSSQNPSEPETDDSIGLDDGTSVEFREIRESWQKLPKLNASLESPTAISQSGPIKLLNDSDLASWSKVKEFRKVVDPIKVAKLDKLERESNAGSRWFNMPKPEMTPQLKRDLQLLKMRHVLDPKRHYKKDNAPLPKYLQTGTLIEGNTEYYSARLSKKERKQTIADEILADVSSRAYYKRKYGEIQTSKMSGRKAFYKKVKEARKKA